ncbi:MAG: LysR family transcriptional regulator [Proteobacteria bacterium]|nr:LysR family transcriptional regulator [Pseudomonadota bacterium]
MNGELKQVADLALFARIVQTGGISRCAEYLGMERTTVSRRLGSLERALGVKLLDRTPRSIAVTDAGRRCLAQCELLLESAQNARSLATLGALSADDAAIVVGAPPDLIDRYIDPHLSAFEAGNPGVRIERHPVTTWDEQAVESVDVGIALAPATVSGGRTSDAGRLRQSVFSSGGYAARHRPLRSLADLARHHAIVEAGETPRETWRFERDGEEVHVALGSTHVVSGLLEAREAVLAGLGIARLPRYLCEPYLYSGRLVDLAPDFESAAREVLVVDPQQRQRKRGLDALRVCLEAVFRHQVD